MQITCILIYLIGMCHLFAARLLKYESELAKPIDAQIEAWELPQGAKAGVQGLRVICR